MMQLQSTSRPYPDCTEYVVYDMGTHVGVLWRLACPGHVYYNTLLTFRLCESYKTEAECVPVLDVWTTV